MKKCKSGYYYCNTDKKCKPIPRGYRVGYGGYLRKENDDDDSKNKSNGNGNGNGNGSNGTAMVAMALAEMVEEEMVVEWVKK